jgi:hypothetical protein
MTPKWRTVFILNIRIRLCVQHIAGSASPYVLSGREGKADAFLNPGLIEVLVICYQTLQEGRCLLSLIYLL